MGCCFSCFNASEKNSQCDEPNERTTLLGNPVSNTIGRPLFSQDFSDVGTGQLGDEQAALNKILHQTVVDIIDVSALPTLIEQKDYIDRVKLYQSKLASIHPRHSRNAKLLLKDVAHPEMVLFENSLLLADIRMMEDAFREVYQSVKGIEVDHQGDLVTKFS